MNEYKELQKSLDSLKDFQIKTVNKIYQVLSDKDNCQNRFLVADEVGLGKTLIAKGVITKFANEYLKENKKLKVVYLCSNQSIANQNIQKLKIFRDENKESVMNTYDSRLTMLPIEQPVHNGVINYIPLTPATSFQVTAGGGRKKERFVIVYMLLKIKRLRNYKDEIKKVLRLNAGEENWNRELDNFLLEKLKLNKNILNRFEEELLSEEQVLNNLLNVCKCERSGKNTNVNINKLIGKLRHIIIKVSVAELKPDIVILDEFQRFKELLELGEESEIDDVKVVANKFFENPNQKTILLSATPYKLYSTSKDLEAGEDHYKEFKQVIEFLLNDEEKLKEFDILWGEYNSVISNLKTISIEEGMIIKNKVENFLKNIMCRTERIVVSNSGNVLIDTSKVKHVEIKESDIESFIRVDKVSEILEGIGYRTYSPMELYKSAPFMYSFMENYKLKKNFIQCLETSQELVNTVKKNKNLFIKKEELRNYNKIDYCSSKFDKVIEESFEYNGQNLLWVPPSIPYYKLEGAYKGAENFSKSLIFSSWEMVPRMMATLLSYESERTTIGELVEADITEDGENESRKNYFGTGSKRFPKRRLNFSPRTKKDKDLIRPKSMSNLALMYPSEYLCNIVDPKENIINKLPISCLLKDLEKTIKDDIKKYNLEQYVSSDAKVEDRGWYYIAPLLIDRAKYKAIADYWFYNVESLARNEKENQKAIAEHLAYLKAIYTKNELNLFGKMPEDLVQVLAIMALGAPAIIAKRTLKGIVGTNRYTYSTLDNMAYKIANEFRLKFAEAESIGVLDSFYKEKEVYWRKVLRYCVDGNLQSVLDEYMYLLYENNKLDDILDISERIETAGNLLINSISLRNSNFSVDTVDSVLKADSKKINLRTHYSVSLSHKNNTDAAQGRTDNVRDVFNSPFRPFVLTSTSIGQEGLDFHWYCRKIIHWNLPSNPVDLEQREGRINRYKGLVIRNNLGRRYNPTKKENNIIDMWNNVFENSEEKKEAPNDLIPYWMLGDDNRDDIVKIERIIPYYPYSKDSEHLENLLKILSIYRISLGQARQEELINYLLQDSNEEKIKEINKLVLNLSPLE